MLLPSKHVRLAESLLGVGALVIESLKEPLTLDALKDELDRCVEREQLPAKPSLEIVVLALDFLFVIGVVKILDNGAITRCVSSL